MIDILLFIGIILFFCYAVYDQFGMDRLKGKTKLKVRLKKQAKSDAVIFIALIAILLYQTKAQISAMTMYLLAMTVVLSIYIAFIRSPVLILKDQGFFHSNLYIGYDKIQQVNLAEGNVFVFELKNGKRLTARLADAADKNKVVAFFGGYKKEMGNA